MRTLVTIYCAVCRTSLCQVVMDSFAAQKLTEMICAECWQAVVRDAEREIPEGD